jgi:general secretion pathway protein G
MLSLSALSRHSREGGNPSPNVEVRALDSRLRGNDEVEVNGFTLVELMVVIVIIGLLTTLVALTVLPNLGKAADQKAKADIATLDQALELYRLNNLTYPSTADGLQALVKPPASLTDPARYQAGGYIKKLPNDPWGRPYLYASPGQHGTFDISTLGADGAPGGTGENADIGNWQ